MNALSISVLVLGVVLHGVLLVVGARQGPSWRTLERFADQAGLTLTHAVQPILARRLAARNRASTLGSLAAFVLSWTALLLVPGGIDGPGVFVLLTGMVLGQAIGGTLADARAALARVGDGPRIARTPAPTLPDYVSAAERRIPPILLLVAAVVIAGAFLLVRLNPDGAFSDASIASVLWLPLALLVVGVATAVAARAVVARLLDHGQPATTLTELVWDDALRSHAVRGNVTVAGIIGLASVYASLIALSTAAYGDGTNDFGVYLSSVLSFVLPAIILVISALSMVSASRRTTRYYLSRLWPETYARLAGEPELVPQRTWTELERHDLDD